MAICGIRLRSYCPAACRDDHPFLGRSSDRSNRTPKRGEDGTRAAARLNRCGGEVGAHFFMLRVPLFYRAMKLALLLGSLLSLAVRVQAQIQVDLKLPRLQFIAYEPLIATLHITNLAGRDIDLHDSDGQRWFGFEI